MKLLPVTHSLDAAPPPSYDVKVEEAEPLRIVETTDGWVPLQEHLAGKHNQKSHGRHHSAAVAATFRDGGYSVNYVGRKPKSGYMVGGMTVVTGKYRRNVPTTMIVDDNPAALRKGLDEFYGKHRELLKQPGNYLGTWRDGGKTYIDISQRVPTRAKALVLGRDRDEKAVYDVRRGVSIELPQHSAWGPETQEWDSDPLI